MKHRMFYQFTKLPFSHEFRSTHDCHHNLPITADSVFFCQKDYFDKLPIFTFMQAFRPIIDSAMHYLGGSDRSLALSSQLIVEAAMVTGGAADIASAMGEAAEGRESVSGIKISMTKRHESKHDEGPPRDGEVPAVVLYLAEVLHVPFLEFALLLARGFIKIFPLS